MTTTTPTEQNADALRRDIERTRYELASDVDRLHEKVSPSAIARRRTESLRNAFTSAKDKIMGGASATSSGIGSIADSTSSGLSDATSTAARKAEGNPLAAGLVAFGAGWLISSLVPATEKEQQAAEAVKEKASEHGDTLTAPVMEAGQQLKESLAPAAQSAAESVKSTAAEAAENVKDTVKSPR